MIRFEKLSKWYWANGERKTVIDELDLTLPTGKSLGLLGRNGAGKSTLINLIAGILPPDQGRVVSDGSISWPVAFGGSFHPELTGAQNVRFVARIYGVDTDSLIDFVADFSELGRYFYMPVRTYSSGMRSRLTFGTSMGIRFDTYLVDEATAVGDDSFRAKSRRVFRERMEASSAILVTHNMNEMRDFCDAGILLDQGKLYYFDDLDEAIASHQDIMRRNRSK
ncbi:ABC transporter ATP-binding protein [Salipiger aestuarii]|uniref:ABC transporter ATP-binding protein n=1 Tax=Salipiger aestuarii TaxID=568098 RepID=UPI00123A0828|nr:ABC transporter ATP-binding protein [Salipiger aestuarii]KAA8610022.1 ABC transporter ATP-binding protein [Salipiger aestuarii]